MYWNDEGALVLSRQEVKTLLAFLDHDEPRMTCLVLVDPAHECVISSDGPTLLALEAGYDAPRVGLRAPEPAACALLKERLPRFMVRRNILTAAAKAAGCIDVELTCADGIVAAFAAGQTFSHANPSGDYPDYRRVIPKRKEVVKAAVQHFDPHYLARLAVAAAACESEEGAKRSKKTHGRVVMSARVQQGAKHEPIRADIEGPRTRATVLVMPRQS